MDRIINFTTKRGAYTKDACKEWFCTVLDELKLSTSVKSIVVICDNAPCHNGLEDVLKETAYQGVTILRLAPYSPMLNPIENIWSIVKANVKKDLRTCHTNLVGGDPTGMLSNQEWRMRQLENIITKATFFITKDHCCKFVHHIEKSCMEALSQ